MKKILLPCDFSKPSEQAFRFAMQVAERSKGAIFVLKVTELPVLYEPGFGVPEYGFDSALLEELEHDAVNELNAMKERCGIVGDNITLLSETGPLIFTIRKIMKTREVDIVIMGTHGEEDWLDSMLGTNTEKIIRCSAVPVIAIRKSVAVDSIRNIVFPTILPLDQQRVIFKIKELQQFFNARLHIVYINSPADFHSDRDIHARMGEFVSLNRFSNYTTNIYNDISDEKGIINFTKEVNGDLIAMPTHGRKGLARLFNYSLTEEVLDEIEWPLWSCVAD